MAWEQRGNGIYYYRSVRIGGRVVKEYCGAGVLAELAAREDDQRRRERAEIETRLRQEREAVAAAVAAHEALSRATDALIMATLTAAGYHRHDRGPWRRRRANQDYERGHRHDTGSH
jgi:hypothetical protein